MPSAGLILTAVLVPLLASLSYSEGGKQLQQQVDWKSFLKMATGEPKLSVAPYEVAQPVSSLAQAFTALC